jgi:hypothetical protein
MSRAGEDRRRRAGPMIGADLGNHIPAGDPNEIVAVLVGLFRSPGPLPRRGDWVGGGVASAPDRYP